MGGIENISAEQLRGHLEKVEKKAETLRLVVGINYKNGVTQSELADWYGVSRTTIHNWLDRLERLDSDPLEEVIHDEKRSGRPSKITESEREQLFSGLQESPRELGIDAPAWSPPLVRAYIREEFDVDYSLKHIRDLMNDAGIVWKTARPDYFEGGERDRETFKEGFKKAE